MKAHLHEKFQVYSPSLWNVFEGIARNKGQFFKYLKLKKWGEKKKNPKTWQIHLGRIKVFSPWHTPLWHTQLPGRWLAPPGTCRSHSGCCSTSLRGTWWCHRPSSSLGKTHTPHSTSRGAAPCAPPKNITQQWAGLSEAPGTVEGAAGVSGVGDFSVPPHRWQSHRSLSDTWLPLSDTHTQCRHFFSTAPRAVEKRTWIQLLNMLRKEPNSFQKPELLTEYDGSFCMSVSDNRLFFKNADLYLHAQQTGRRGTEV